MTTDHSSPLIIQTIDDLRCIRESGAATVPEEIRFQLNVLKPEEFRSFVQVLTASSSLFDDVSTVYLESDHTISWATRTARDFVDWIAGMPNLRTFTWKSVANSQHPLCLKEGTGIPMPLLTMLCSYSPNLESLTLTGLSFLTCNPPPPTYNPNDEAVIPNEAAYYNDPLSDFCRTIKRHSKLKLFHWDQCLVWNAGTLASCYRPMESYFVDWIVSSLVFIKSLECIDMKVMATPTSDDNDSPGKLLLGLCKQGEITEAALERFHQVLRQTNDPALLSCCEKIRVWIADGYDEPAKQDRSQLLLDVAPLLAQNMAVKDFRVRGNNPEIYVTPKVIDAYKELLESGENISMTNCDLMTKQGDQIDFYCRLNGMGRGALMRRLQQDLAPEQWIEEILLRFGNDLDCLFYWNRLHPIFFT